MDDQQRRHTLGFRLQSVDSSPSGGRELEAAASLDGVDRHVAPAEGATGRRHGPVACGPLGRQHTPTLRTVKVTIPTVESCAPREQMLQGEPLATEH